MVDGKEEIKQEVSEKEQKLMDQLALHQKALKNSVSLGKEETVPGFRKGITKRSLIEGLSDDDWKFIDKCKKADDMMASDNAYKIFIRADQMYQEFLKIKSVVRDTLAAVLLLHYDMNKNTAKISIGGDLLDVEGKSVTPDELVCFNMKQQSKIDIAFGLLYANLARLYTMVGKQGLNRKPFFSEEEYNEIIENIMAKLKKTPYELY